MTWLVLITPEARRMLEQVPDRRERLLIAKRIEALRDDPEKQGKALLGELATLRSVRAAGQRYRILYRVERQVVQVIVVALGRRKSGSSRDVYALAKKLIKLRLAP
ncbi:MAG: type II toxin-antitoxin system RelE/ParE family toxin [Acidobacteriota bacterium]